MNLARLIVAIVTLLPLVAQAQDPQQIYLWPKGAPGYESRRNEPEQAKDWWVKNVNNPSITVYLPPKEKANGMAVLICPGGGFRTLVFNGEGRDPALYFNNLGVAAFVLKYRLFREENSPYSYEKETKEDVYRAMRVVRSHAKEWNFDPNRLGLMGFSAGGEVVAVAAYAPGDGDPKAADPIDRLNGRPNFQILIYPGPLGIPDSVPADVPPAFLLVSNMDPCCSGPTVKLLQAYRNAKASVELHLYDKGDHGFNMGYRSTLKTVKNWPQRLTDWLEDNYYFDPTKAEEAKKAR